MSKIPELKLIPESVRREIEEQINGPEDAREAQERHRLLNSCIRGEMSNLIPLAEAFASQLRRELRICVRCTQRIRDRKTDLLSTAIWPHMVDRFRQERESLQRVGRATDHEIDLFGHDFPVTGSPDPYVVIEMQEQMRRGWPAAVMIVWNSLYAEFELQRSQLEANTDQPLVSNTQVGAPALHGTFVKEGATWNIKYGGETCRLPASLIGLDYLSVLLRYPGRSILAVKLRAQGAAAVPADPGTLRDLQTEPGAGLQTDWATQLVLDPTAKASYRATIKDLDIRIIYAEDTGNTHEVAMLKQEKTALTRELAKQSGLLGRPRMFANQEENARTTVTHAIDFALKKIEKTAPTIAQYLRDNIATGKSLIYKDCSVAWKT